MNKRSFLKNAGLLGIALPLNLLDLEIAVAEVSHLGNMDVADNAAGSDPGRFAG